MTGAAVALAYPHRPPLISARRHHPPQAGRQAGRPVAGAVGAASPGIEVSPAVARGGLSYLPDAATRVLLRGSIEEATAEVVVARRTPTAMLSSSTKFLSDGTAPEVTRAYDDGPSTVADIYS